MLKRGFKAEAERKASFYRQLLEFKEHDPLPSRKLAEKLEIKLLIPQDIPGMDDNLLDKLLVDGKDLWSAAIYQKEDKKYIIHNPTHSPFRQESDLMHEIAHAICNHELNNLETAIMDCVIPLRKYDQEQEDEAEWLGASLQLPQKALFHYYKIKKMDEAAISRHFNASEKMVRYRLGVTGVKKISWQK